MDQGLAFTAALLGSIVYFSGFAVFKVAARRMPPLRGTQPLRFIGQVLSSPIWLAGAAVMGVGMVLQFNALVHLPLTRAVPAFLLALPALPVIACGVFGEPVSRVEGVSMAVMGVGALLIAGAGAEAVPDELGPLALALIVVPSQVLPIVLFSAGDWHEEGQHARRLSGIAYGLSAGVLIGLAEFTLGVIARHEIVPATLATPYPYVFVLAASTGIAQLQIALQRCRMVIILFIATVTAKSYLVAVTGVLALTDSPVRPLTPWLLTAGVFLFFFALLTVPRYESHRTGRH
ncbi:hypothetical protein [Actinocorallia longicatena]|uniref:EamA-like transporter family protein n=1 Tax=Actinocorallia longicatena TaxID=111803 RepID=A0ABP6QJT2_9ACTN